MSGGRALRVELGGGLNEKKMAELQEVARRLMDEAGVTDKQRSGLFVVIDELCTNVLEHSGAGWIEMAVVTGDGQACLSLSDNGKPFDSAAVIQGRDFSGELGSEDGRNLGLYMLKQLTQSMRYLREEGGVNRVTLQLAPGGKK